MLVNNANLCCLTNLCKHANFTLKQCTLGVHVTTWMKYIHTIVNDALVQWFLMLTTPEIPITKDIGLETPHPRLCRWSMWWPLLVYLRVEKNTLAFLLKTPRFPAGTALRATGLVPCSDLRAVCRSHSNFALYLQTPFEPHEEIYKLQMYTLNETAKLP